VHFVGGHPIAGLETSGVEAADPLLFNERVYMLCPDQETPPEALLAVLDIVDDLSAVPVTIEPEEHDRILAVVSHVPQLLAIALVHAALEDDGTHGLLDTIAGPGFLGLTRVAASDFEVWRSILETNLPAIRRGLDRLEASLAAVRSSLGSEELGALWQTVSSRRRKMSVDTLPRPRKPELRQLVDRYDEQILKALGNRLKVVRKIGAIKQSAEMPVGDPDRERNLMRTRLEWARALDVPEEVAEELFQVIVKHGRKAQGS
jgi:prephenate dehydrogenase